MSTSSELVPRASLAIEKTPVPAGFLNRSDEATLVRGVTRAVIKTESYIKTPKLRAAIKEHVDALIDKYNDHIQGLLERIEDLQNALRESDEKLAVANKKLVDLFGSDTKDRINDEYITGLFEEWDNLRIPGQLKAE